MQRIDERPLVAAIKPGLVLLDTPKLNAETPAHLLDDDITPTARLFARNTGAMPMFGASEMARATDTQGAMQPTQSAPWNPRGYLNNICHRVRGRIG